MSAQKKPPARANGDEHTAPALCGNDTERQYDSFLVHKDIFEVCQMTNPDAFAVFVYLARRQGKNQDCHPHQATIATDLGMPLRSVQRAIRALKDSDLLTVASECHQGNRYSIAERYRATAKLARASTEQPPNRREAAAKLAREQPPNRRTEGNTYEGKTFKGVTPPNPPRGNSVVVFPPELDFDECRAAWSEWIAYRRESKKPLKVVSQQKQLKQWADRGSARFVAAINHSIAQGYQGLYEPKSGEHTNGHTARRDSLNGDVYAEILAELE